MREHTKEPWKVDPKATLRVVDSEDRTIVSCAGSDFLRDEWEANARRIVACVNWCEGIPIEILEAKDDFTRLADYYRVSKQRDELLAAMKQAAIEIKRCDYTPARSTILIAIAKVEGEK